MIMVIISLIVIRQARLRFRVPSLINCLSHSGINTRQKSSTSQNNSTNLLMPFPYLSNFSWSKDLIVEQALSSIFYPELRLIIFLRKYLSILLRLEAVPVAEQHNKDLPLK